MTTATEYAERWQIRLAELQGKIDLTEDEAELATLREQLAAHEEVRPGSPGAAGGRRPGRGQREMPTWSQLNGATMGVTCVYCEQRDGVDRDVDGRMTCKAKACQAAARKLARKRRG